MFGKVLIIFLMAATLIFGKSVSEEKKIDLLIDSINSAPNGTMFIRNGEAHSAQAAAEHMRYKYSRAKNKIKNVDDFIERIGTKSLFTGKVYFIRFPDNTTITVNEFLKKELLKIEKNLK